jgi:homoserine kinase
MRITVRAPATVANLGPGFDCFGLALEVFSEFVIDTALEPGVEVDGEDAGELPADGSNLVFRTITFLGREAGGAPPPFRLSCRNGIPLERGLGSSAAAVVAGVLLGDRLLGLDLGPDRLLEFAVDVEGHADNVAACLRGGLTLAYLSQAGWRAERLAPSPELRPVLLIPRAERMSTKDARRVIPERVPFPDAVFNASRSALALLALTARPALLGVALDDRLHQPYRLPHLPAARSLFEDLRQAGIPVCVAGSGPTLLAFEDEERRLWELGPMWRVLRPAVASGGATVAAG